VAEVAIPVEAWPICSSMGAMVESADWAALDPDFAAGKRAIVAGDWNGAINALTSAGLRDDRNADIQNYLGYAYRRLRQSCDATLPAGADAQSSAPQRARAPRRSIPGAGRPNQSRRAPGGTGENLPHSLRGIR
jgi:hypothetical protein